MTALISFLLVMQSVSFHSCFIYLFSDTGVYLWLPGNVNFIPIINWIGLTYKKEVQDDGRVYVKTNDNSFLFHSSFVQYEYPHFYEYLKLFFGGKLLSSWNTSLFWNKNKMKICVKSHEVTFSSYFLVHLFIWTMSNTKLQKIQRNVAVIVFFVIHV